MTLDRINQLRNLIYKVHNNNWKRRTGTRSEREAADSSDMDVVDKLCGALDEALTELEKTGDKHE